MPGALIQATVDPSSPIAYGLPEHIDLFFEDSPVLAPTPGAADLKSPVRFTATPALRSGWAHGLERLRDAAAVVQYPRGEGRITLFGPEIALRGQTHGAFKLLFNAMYLSAIEQPVGNGNPLRNAKDGLGQSVAIHRTK